MKKLFILSMMLMFVSGCGTAVNSITDITLPDDVTIPLTIPENSITDDNSTNQTTINNTVDPTANNTVIDDLSTPIQTSENPFVEQVGDTSIGVIANTINNYDPHNIVTDTGTTIITDQTQVGLQRNDGSSLAAHDFMGRQTSTGINHAETGYILIDLLVDYKIVSFSISVRQIYVTYSQTYQNDELIAPLYVQVSDDKTAWNTIATLDFESIPLTLEGALDVGVKIGAMCFVRISWDVIDNGVNNGGRFFIDNLKYSRN